jgi:hypothetical protein
MSERRPDETDDSYYMRVYREMGALYPDLESYLLHFGVCVETRLPCVHPFPLREYHSPSGTMVLTEFLAAESPRRFREDRECRERVLSRTQCMVCGTWAPHEPFDICRDREMKLAGILSCVESGPD